MANLIVTIISIALVAVAAVMGAYYGGTAFQNSQIKAYAAQTIQTMQQIKAAAYLYAENNPNYGSFTTPRQWGVALTTNTNNTQYLSLTYYAGPFCSSTEYNSFNINYGSAGNLLDWSNGGMGCGVSSPLSGTAYIGLGDLNIVADPTGNHLYVVWMVDGPNAISNDKFYTNLCYTINQQMGQIPYASSLTLSNNVGYTNLSIPNGNDTTNRPGFSENPTAFTGLSNICSLNPNEGATTSPEYEFAIPIF